jgi:hypothetical protein
MAGSCSRLDMEILLKPRCLKGVPNPAYLGTAYVDRTANDSKTLQNTTGVPGI